MVETVSGESIVLLPLDVAPVDEFKGGPFCRLISQDSKAALSKNPYCHVTAHKVSHLGNYPLLNTDIELQYVQEMDLG